MWGPRDPSELLFQLLLSPLAQSKSFWCQSYTSAGTSQASCGQNENVTCWKWAHFFETPGSKWMSSSTWTDSCEGDWFLFLKMKILDCLHFNKKPLTSFVFLSSLPSASKISKGKIANIVWQFKWVQLEEVFDFTMFKKKNVRWDCVWTVQRGKWLEEGRSCWSGVCSPDTLDGGMMWLMQMSPSSVSVHSAVTGAVTLSLNF